MLLLMVRKTLIADRTSSQAWRKMPGEPGARESRGSGMRKAPLLLIFMENYMPPPSEETKHCAFLLAKL